MLNIEVSEEDFFQLVDFATIYERGDEKTWKHWNKNHIKIDPNKPLYLYYANEYVSCMLMRAYLHNINEEANIFFDEENEYCVVMSTHKGRILEIGNPQNDESVENS